MTDIGFQRVARVASVVAILLGATGLLGWILDVAVLKSVLPGHVTMKANTAVSFVLAGTSLLLQTEPTSPSVRIMTGRLCAALVAALGTLTLFEYVLGVDFGIDQLLVRAPAGELQTSSPGRMAPNTALSFAFLGQALLLLDSERHVLRSMTQVLAVTVLLIGFVAITGYVLSVTALFGVAGYTSMAVHTAAGITSLSIGVLVSRPQRGVVAIVAQNNRSGAALRRFLPFVLLAPLALGWLRMEGQRAGFYGTEFGVALTVAAGTSIVTSVVVWNARVQGAAEAAQQQALRDAHFLFELSELLRTSSKSSDVLFDVSKKLGEYVGASRCVFIEVDIASELVTIHRDYCKGLPSIVGTISLSSFSPEGLAAAAAGRVLVSSDTSLDALTLKQYEGTYRAAGIRARVVVPLLRDGQYASTLLVSSHEPREWQAREVELIQAVAERTWVWFEHLGTLEALRERERALAENEERFRLFVDAAKDYAIYFLDAQGKVATWNAGAERLNGYRSDEIVGGNFSVFYPSEDVAVGKPQKDLEAAAREGSHEEEGWRLRRDGSRLRVNVTLSALQNTAGELIGFGQVTRDMTERERASEQFRLAIEAAPTGMLMVDSAGTIVLVNLQAQQLFGYDRGELLGKSMEVLVPERFRHLHPEHRRYFRRQPESRSMGAGRELYGLRKDGSEVAIEIVLNPLRLSEGDFVLSSIVDITERKRADGEREALLAQLKELNVSLERRVQARTADLAATLEEREVLLQEIHHRVKNNLCVIVSLMEMQARTLKHSEGRRVLEECQGRVHAIALIHEKLYQSENYAEIPFADYLRGLADDVFHVTGVSHATVGLTLAVADVPMTVAKAIPCGLILNELITNSLKHAFPGGRSGMVRVELEKADPGRLRLVVADDGVGLPPGLNIHDAHSLGLRLVGTLAGQLNGEITVNGGHGTSFELEFPVETRQA